MDESVLIGVGKTSENGERWESRGGLIRLNLLDNCNVRSIDEIKLAPPISRRINNSPLPIIWSVEDRELVSAVDLVIGVRDQYGYEMVQRASHVVDGVPEDYPPVGAWDGLSFFEDEGMRLIKRVVAGFHGLTVEFHHLPHLVNQSVEVVFGAVEFGRGAGQVECHAE
jgi:hypothetical protein